MAPARVFSITPDSGYRVSSVVVDGVSVGAVSTYSFTNVQSDHVIVASFVSDQYVLATSVVGQGSVSRSPSQSSYAAGSTVQLTATAGPRVEI